MDVRTGKDAEDKWDGRGLFLFAFSPSFDREAGSRLALVFVRLVNWLKLFRRLPFFPGGSGEELSVSELSPPPRLLLGCWVCCSGSSGD